MKTKYVIQVFFIVLLLCGCKNLNEIYDIELTLPYKNKSQITGCPQLWGTGIWGHDRFHYGVDFKGTTDTIFIAVADGVIIDIQKKWIGDTAGWAVSIKQEINPLYIIMYVFEPYNAMNDAIYDEQLKRIEVKPGDRVNRGQIIGRLYAHGIYPHLHLGVMRNSEFVDPLPFFTKSAQDEIIELYKVFWGL